MKTYVAICCLAAFAFLAPHAFADRTYTLVSAQAEITDVSASKTAAGWSATVCGRTKGIDGGAVPLEQPCVPCSAATFAGLPAACLTAFRDANGL